MPTGTHPWLDAPVTEVDGVSPRVAGQLEKTFAITTVRDLLEHYPHQDKYRDIGAQRPLAETRVGEAVTVVGHIVSWNVIRPRGRGKLRSIAKAVVIDDHGGRVEVPFFNQDWRPKQTPEGSRVAVSGTLEQFRSTLQLKGAKLIVVEDTSADDHAATAVDLDRIQPTWPATEALPSPRLGQLIRAALDALPPLEDHLPPHLREQRGLLALDTALRRIHRPADLTDVKPARERLVYDELLCLQVGLQQRRRRLEETVQGVVHEPVLGGTADHLLAALPFTVTSAQQRAMTEIGSDLSAGKPMHRLLQGDVGAGKTLVAAWTMLRAVDAGRQAVLMAPTGVLAEQHLRTFSSLLAPLGAGVAGGLRVELVTGTTPAKRLRQILADLVAGDVHLLIGTHALLEERVGFFDLGVVVIDEQHRFGVEHRTRLRDKRGDGRTPDVLVMTATPIPRSLALTLYGDLDVTVLDELPPGRQPVVTQVIHTASPRRAALYDFVRERVAAGERAYVVCPLVDESEALGEVASAEAHHAELTREFPDLRVGLVHGRLAASERDEVMTAFRAGDVQILVSTTVIEVGVDVPEASIMIVEDANRFGISQLHQLRGRVGRGTSKSYCVLFAESPDDNPRLDALARTTDGFELAEVDLALRGEGSLFDTRQSGLPDLKLAVLTRDLALVQASRDDARALVAADPELDEHPLLRDEVARRYGEERLAALETG